MKNHRSEDLTEKLDSNNKPLKIVFYTHSNKSKYSSTKPEHHLSSE